MQGERAADVRRDNEILLVHFGQGLQHLGHWRIVNTSETGLSFRAATTASGSSKSRLIHRIILFPFTLPAPRWRFTSRRRDDVQLTVRQPAHPPARGQLLIHAHPSPLSVPSCRNPIQPAPSPAAPP
jgi:hypothetical protein